MPTALSSTVPSSFPTMNFDLQNCATYSRRWILDISESCDELLQDCKCPSAKRLIEDGKINCQVDRCPDDCEVCSFCLDDVLSCYSSAKTSSPTNVPSLELSYHPTDLPSRTPVMLPSVSPTLSPTTMPSAVQSGTPSISQSPSNSFDLSVCSTYANRWLRDLDQTCGGDPALNSGSCACRDARARIESGQIECGIAQCPDDCAVCKFCLYEVESCPWLVSPSHSPTLVRTRFPSSSPTRFPTVSPTKQPSKLYDLSNCES
jgi:hypothetical protein